jgi:hypothetical protein
MALTSEAKKLLAATIRGTAQDPAKGLRHRLLEAIKSEAAGRYRLAVPLKEAKLDEAHHRRRERLEAYLDEKTRATKPKSASEGAKTRERLLREAEKEAAATLLNRLVTLRLLEARGLARVPLVTGGWNSKGYRQFRDFAPGLIDDETEGYSFVLRLLFDDLATELPGLFGDVGVTALFPIPSKSLREVVEALDNPELTSAWTDDTTLGWVYQFWNDPDREALDWKISPQGGGGKILPHEIASKTQMFTERYMVEWLLQNSLGTTWLCMCRKHGWTADAERVLPVLDQRRADWRKRYELGDVAVDALMPVEGELEQHWKYYVAQALRDDAIATAPQSVRAIKLLDPACGSGHFLVIAFDLLASFYREEARHTGKSITDREIADSILESNLHGIDIDARAIQIAAAALYLKAKTFSKEARPRRLNLVAPALQLGQLPASDQAIVQLRRDLTGEVGIPEELTTKLLSSLSGVDYLGSLLKVDGAVDDALRSVELEFERTHGQGNLFSGFPAQQVKLSLAEAKATVLDRLERFLARHSSSEDLGLRLDGEQLAAGVRFVRMAKAGTYDVVVGNPPYQGLSKTESFGYVANIYAEGKADLYAAFLERGLELARNGGISALLTMRGWMFLGQFTELRSRLLACQLLVLGDLDRGAFSEIAGGPGGVAVAASVFCKLPSDGTAAAIRAYEPGDTSGVGIVGRRQAWLLAQRDRFDFDPRRFNVIEAQPLVYWWDRTFLERYARAPKLGTQSPARLGLTTGDNQRFLRKWFEVSRARICAIRINDSQPVDLDSWSPYVLGAKGRCWVDPLIDVVRWKGNGLEVKEKCIGQYGSISKQIRNERWYFCDGVAFSTIGTAFGARRRRYKAVFDVSGSSVFVSPTENVLCLMNSRTSRQLVQDLNPSVNFQPGDVSRLAVFPVSDARLVADRIEQTFAETEAAREPSIEFRRPGPTAWNYAQAWAQEAVDRLEDGGAVVPLAPYEPVYDSPAPEATLSFALGVALGRFDASGKGVLDPHSNRGIAHGILFLTARESGEGLGIGDEACVELRQAWDERSIGTGSLTTYLRTQFFEYHKKLYDNRPIYFPLSSAKRSFVAFVSIHRWQADTLSVLLADHLMPAKKKFEGERDDLRTAKASQADGANRTAVEKRFDELQRLLEELTEFITKVSEIADRGPPPSDDRTAKREADARFVMDLDDGVMVNSAALWPLLEPQWKEPKKWWKQLANAQGKRDFDWSHLAARYFPTRVRKKCHEDPSLAIAHGCFWELHPAKAYAWELRLQDEIKPDFTIDEPGSDVSRNKFVAEHAGEAKEILAAEMKRRERKAAKAEDQAELFDEASDADAEGEADD